MKRHLWFTFAFVLTCAFCFAGSPAVAQTSGQRLVVLSSELLSEHVTLTLTGNNARDTVFVLYWPVTLRDRFSPTAGAAPTASATQAAQGISYYGGNVSVTMTTDSVGSADESDSLLTTVKPFVFNTRSTRPLGFYAIPLNKLFYVDFTSAATMTSASVQWLNWVDGGSYYSNLTGALYPADGFAYILEQDAAAVGATVTTRVNLEFKLGR